MPRTRGRRKNGASKQLENFFAADCDELIWDSDGYGYLPGSAMRFRRNQFGLIELHDTSSIDIDDLIQNGGNSSDASDTAEGRTICELCCSEILIRDSHEGQGRFCIVCAPKYDHSTPDARAIDLLCAAGGRDRGLESQVSQLTKSDCRSESSLDSTEQSTSMFGRKRKVRRIDGEVIRLPSKRDKNDKSTAPECEEFCWEDYLRRNHSTAAPHALFPHVERGFPEAKFEQGSMLEGIDPNHENLFCALSVAEVIGQRLRLHFEGYPEKFDFWTNSNSPFIFPVQFCKRNDKRLCPPRGYRPDEFDWTNYLTLKKAKPADAKLFRVPEGSEPRHEFRVGRKLEAVDKRNPDMICVATIADVLGEFVLIHFDGWHTSFDQWAHIDSPFLLPVGHCEEYGKMLALPSTWSEDRLEEFTWELYLREERAEAVPRPAFRTRRPPLPFEKGMKLEAVDRRCPRLLRVASVVEVDNYHVLFRYDGWPDKYNQCVEDDCPDIFPMFYCSSTGHPLQAPPGLSDASLTTAARPPSGCPTYGCRGIGHVKGPKFTSHSSLSGCPYSDVNMKNERFLDRFAEAPPLNPRRRGHGALGRRKLLSQLSDAPSESHMSGDIPPPCESPDTTGPPVKVSKPRGRPKKYVSNPDSTTAPPSVPSSSLIDDVTVTSCVTGATESPEAKSPADPEEEDPPTPQVESPGANRTLSSQSCSWSESDSKAVERSILEPIYEPYSLEKEELRVMHHIRHILEVDLAEDAKDVLRWSALRVSTFVQAVLGCTRYSRRIVHEEIDGDAFLKLEQVDMQLWDMPLGHSTKLMSVIQYFRLKLKLKIDSEDVTPNGSLSPPSSEPHVNGQEEGCARVSTVSGIMKRMLKKEPHAHR